MNAELTVADALREITRQLATIASDAPELEACVLIENACGFRRADLLSRLFAPLPRDGQVNLGNSVFRRLRREPLAYIVGEREFYGRAFSVDARVLIPRPESEAIVDTVLAEVPRDCALRVLDVGTGSGSLAITLTSELPHAWVLATDRSESALAVACHNACRHGVADRTAFACADLATGINGSFHLIVANLPYLSARRLAQIGPEVAAEPRGALDGGADGLSLYRRLAPDLPRLLLPGGCFLGEVDPEQVTALGALLSAAIPDATVTAIRDLSGDERVVLLRRRPILNQRV